MSEPRFQTVRCATSATQISGERCLFLYKQSNTRTARNFQRLGHVFQLARITCDTCTCPPLVLQSVLDGRRRDAARDTAHCDTLKRSIRNSIDPQHCSSRQENYEKKKKERRLPLHCSLPLRTGPFLFLLPIVLKVLPPRLLGFSCEPQTTHVALKNLSLTTSVGMGFSICFNVSH